LKVFVEINQLLA